MRGGQHREKDVDMKKASRRKRDELRREYDLSQLEAGVRGKYYRRFTAGTNLVLLDPDVAKAFPTGEAVNEALRVIVKASRRAGVRRSTRRKRA
jgi:hypothetical protein